MSEMVWEFAGEFIRLGETLAHRQIRLNAAVSAWNLACLPPEARPRAMDEYITSCKSHNPRVTDEQLSGIRGDMEKLVGSKLSLFPAINKPIVGARISRVGGRDRIDVASVRVE